METSKDSLVPEGFSDDLNNSLDELIEIGFLTEDSDGKLNFTQKGVKYCVKEGLVDAKDSETYPFYHIN